MGEVTATERPPEPDFSAIAAEELLAYRGCDRDTRQRGNGMIL